MKHQEQVKLAGCHPVSDPSYITMSGDRMYFDIYKIIQWTIGIIDLCIHASTIEVLCIPVNFITAITGFGVEKVFDWWGEVR